MRQACFFLLFVIALSACSSPGKKPGPESKPVRMDSTFSGGDSITVPPYGLDKVIALIDSIKTVDDTSGADESYDALDEKAYASLSFDEKFTYHMIHPEVHSQMCDILPERKDEAKRIYGEIPNFFGEYGWGDRQMKFFQDNKDSVVALMKALITGSDTVGVNFKQVIVEINAREMIPFLVDAYNKDKRDHYILTVLMLLMTKNKDPEFTQSASYKKLYGSDSEQYSAFLTYNQANEDLIIKRATDFYNGLSQK